MDFSCTATFPQGLRGIIFDCDGVMFDSREANISYYNLILKALDMPLMTASQEDYVHMHAVRESLEHIVPAERMGDLPKARATVDYREHVMPFLQPEPGLVDVLQYLRDNAIRAAVHTNRSNSMEYVLEHFAMSAFFHPVMTAAKVRPKPDPEGVHVILADWNIPKEQVVFLGDSQLDEQAARNAGIAFWAYRNTSLTADAHITSFAMMASLVRLCQAGTTAA